VKELYTSAILGGMAVQVGGRTRRSWRALPGSFRAWKRASREKDEERRERRREEEKRERESKEKREKKEEERERTGGENCFITGWVSTAVADGGGRGVGLPARCEVRTLLVRKSHEGVRPRAPLMPTTFTSIVRRSTTARASKSSTLFQKHQTGIASQPAFRKAPGGGRESPP